MQIIGYSQANSGVNSDLLALEWVCHDIVIVIVGANVKFNGSHQNRNGWLGNSGADISYVGTVLATGSTHMSNIVLWGHGIQFSNPRCSNDVQCWPLVGPKCSQVEWLFEMLREV